MRKNPVLLILLVLITGCSKLPCKPASFYAPPPDAPYTAEEVKILAPAGHMLVGTLTVPSDKGPLFPAVVLITGSSPQDRDMVGSYWGTRKQYYRPFRQIADDLSRRGIAVLRMDDQGSGCSEGGPHYDIPIQERANDIRAGLTYLRTRGDIDHKRLGLLGLSEGGNIGPMVAASDPTIAFVVILAGTATNGYLIQEYQWRYQLDNTPGLSDDERKYQEEVIDKKVRNMRDYFARGEGTPWEKSFVSYSPLTSARKLYCPVLILHGDRDAHVPVEHSSMLAQAIRANGNQDVTVIIFKNHNHLLLKDPDGRKSEYSKLLKHTNQLSQNVLNTISDWVVNRLKGGT